jgi:hypothetical protein
VSLASVPDESEVSTVPVAFVPPLLAFLMFLMLTLLHASPLLLASLQLLASFLLLAFHPFFFLVLADVPSDSKIIY